ncbi:hypothetical protein WA158_001891 [Blastocystis sp. Blastoise]
MNSSNTPADNQTPAEAPQESVMALIKKEFFDITEKDKDEDLKSSQYYNLTVSGVLQECRLFNDASVVTQKPDQCIVLIAKLLYLMNNDGKEFSSQEISDVFFNSTKLFQSQNPNLRRMTYLFIKEVAEKTSSEEVIIVVSTLLKDLNSETELFRSNAVRVLSRILDANMLQQVERYIKQAIVHKNPAVSSASLLSGLYLYSEAPDIIRRWINEINQQLASKEEFVQYHSILLLYLIKQNDKLALNKLLNQLRTTDGYSAISICTIIRYTVQFMITNKEENMNSLNSGSNGNLYKDIYDYLIRCLRHPSEMVSLEAARAICLLPDASEDDLIPAVNMLQMGLSSCRPATRFASIRTLNQLSIDHPSILTGCNNDLETLLNDPNRAIATLAISTLLKTVNENKVESLIKQITTSLNEIDDEFKQVLIKAIYILCNKYTNKYVILLNFLASFLREEGSYDMKAAVVNTIIHIVIDIPISLEIGLSILCEFIEDCEFTQLNVKIIDLLAQYGPTTSRPSKYIRFIYNRIILENAIIRGAAVSALTIIGLKVPSLAHSIKLLIKRCLEDEDDEVRDRSILALEALNASSSTSSTSASISTALLTPFPSSYSPEYLKASLDVYKVSQTEGDIEWDVLPQITLSVPATTPSTDSGVLSTPVAAASSTSPAIENTIMNLYKIPEFSGLGPLIHTCAPLALTEEETEYVVSVYKHIFNNMIVFEFLIKNTVDDQLLENALIDMSINEGDSEEWVLTNQIPADIIRFNEVGRCYISYAYAYDEEYILPEASFNCTLRCKTKEVDNNGEPDEDDEGYDEEYPIESFIITTVDYIGKSLISDYRSEWNEIGAENELSSKLTLPFTDLQEAVTNIINITGLSPLEGSGTIPNGAHSHNLILGGKMVGQLLILLRGQIVMTKELGCVLKVSIRCSCSNVNEMMLALFQ